MSNRLTEKLPADVDHFLMDMAQMFGEFDYIDISKFSQAATTNEIKLLREQMGALADLEYQIEEDAEAERIFAGIARMIKGKENA